MSEEKKELKTPTRQQGKRFYGGQPYDKLWADMPKIAALYKQASYGNWMGNRLAAIRATREIVAKSATAQAYLSAARAKVVGDVCPMPTFSNVKSLKDREALTELWRRWAHDPTTDGNESLTSLLRSALTTMLIDGRVFLLIRYHKDFEAGLALQPITRDWLADQEVAGAKVKYKQGEGISGVIRNKSSGRISHYVFYGERQDTMEQLEDEVFTLSKSFIGVSQASIGKKVIIPAAKVLDLFCSRQADDYNGDVSHLCPALDVLQDLTRLEKSLIQSSEFAAVQGGFIEQSESAPFLKEAQEEGAEEDIIANPAEFPPSTELYTLQRGSKFAQFKHAAPNGDINQLRDAMIMTVAASLGVNANSLTGNDSKANYSSMRAADMKARETYFIYQEALRRKVILPVLKAVIDSAIMRDEINISRASYKSALMTEVRQKHFEHTSPEEDMKAAMLQIQAGVLSPKALALQLGRDYDAVMKENAEAKVMAEELNLPFPPGAPSMPAQPNNETDGEESPEELEADAEGTAENE